LLNKKNLNARYYKLAEKWYNGTITSDELKELESWFDIDDLNVEVPSSFVDGEEIHSERMFSAINFKANGELLNKRIGFKFWLRIAASIILLIGLGTYLWIVNNKSEQKIAIVDQAHPVIPGGNRAILTLSDGKQIILDDASQGNIAQQGNVNVVKWSNGQVAYDVIRSADGEDDVMINTMSTPRGGKYELILPDGSKIWLNSSSSITYPTVFKDNQRLVKISGEVYFDIAHNKNKPFVVEINDKNFIEVLGTQFNVNSYGDENIISTTLIDGSVRIKNEKQSVVITPGQQVLTEAVSGNVNKKLRVVNSVDVNQVVSWRKGVFDFNDVSIQNAMSQISRWYDVDIAYEGAIPTDILSGQLPMDTKIDRVLKILEEIGIRFTIVGKKIIIRKS
jgi:transmembrane sensor